MSKNAFPYANGLYIGGGMRVKTFEKLEGISYSKPEKSFEKACLDHEDLPIICDTCKHSDKVKNTCSLLKIDKLKFSELQEYNLCSEFIKL
jgi:hypothetical protein